VPCLAKDLRFAGRTSRVRQGASHDVGRETSRGPLGCSRKTPGTSWSVRHRPLSVGSVLTPRPKALVEQPKTTDG
jgi:hypothetical protein